MGFTNQIIQNNQCQIEIFTPEEEDSDSDGRDTLMQIGRFEKSGETKRQRTLSLEPE